MLDASRDAEREADEDAVRFLEAAGRPTAAAADALCLLLEVEDEAGEVGLPGMLSTHPDLRERIAHARGVGGAPADVGCEASEE